MYVSGKYKITTEIFWSNYIIIRLLIKLLEVVIELILIRNEIPSQPQY